MPLNYFEVTEKHIEDLIKSQEFNVFKTEIEKMLNIQYVKYEVKYDDVAIGEDGYPEPFINAKLIFKNNYSEIDKMIFYTKSIQDQISRTFSKLFIKKEALYKVVGIYVKTILIHEFIHIEQFQQKRLNKDIMEEEKKLLHDDRPLEIEANERAKDIIGNCGKFESEITEYIFSTRSIDNDLMIKLLDLL